MRQTTARMIEVYLRADDSLDAAARKRLLSRLNIAPSDEPPAPPTDRLLRRAEVGKMLARSAKTVDRLAAAGILRRVILPSRKRAAGYLLSDLHALISARTASSAVGEP